MKKSGMKISKMPSSVRKLYAVAKKTRLNSYSPYSQCKVGAAIRTKKGKIYGGCNVENSSFSATICAERGAILSAVAAEGPMKITEVMVVTDETPPWPPCGVCRQVISEFAVPKMMIHAANLKGEVYSLSFEELVPQAFTSEHLMK